MNYRSAGLCAAGFLLSASAFAACPAGTTLKGQYQGQEICALSGTYTSNLVLTNDKLWSLEGGVFIGGDNTDSATLTIQPGSKVFGSKGLDFLVINRGSKIMAEGTASAPIVFTTAQLQGRSRGMWGGLILNGNAPINSCNNPGQLCEAEGEGGTGKYGGTDPFDSSGVLKYVRVEFAGYPITPENELNGIAFQGVGAGTTVDYIQVHMNADDGVEFFGGTVNAKHIVLTGNKDDSLDWVLGWQGKVQYVMIQQYDDQGNNGIEADNFKSPQNALPRSNPEIANMTMIGTSGDLAKGGAGMLLRRGTGLTLYNTVITGFKSSCIDIDDTETFSNGAVFKNGALESANGLQMTHSVINCSRTFDVEGGDLWNTSGWYSAQAGNSIQDPGLNGWIPAAGSPLKGNGITPFDLFFDEVDFIGAIRDEASDWTAGWTTSARN